MAKPGQRGIPGIGALAALACLWSAAAIAQEEDGGLAAQVELGAISTTGNTEDRNVRFRGKLGWSRNAWDYALSLDGFRSSKEGELAARRLYSVADARYAVNEDSFVQARLSHEDDRFGGYDSQTDLSLSYGRNLLTGRADMTLSLSAGVGARQSRDEAAMRDLDEAIARLGADFAWSISDAAVFSQELLVDAGGEIGVLRAESGIETRILGNLSLRFSFNLKRQSEVPAGREKTDTETSVTLLMRF